MVFSLPSLPSALHRELLPSCRAALSTAEPARLLWGSEEASRGFCKLIFGMSADLSPPKPLFEASVCFLHLCVQDKGVNHHLSTFGWPGTR